jgi:uncharacterized tellurite resistance protein B-like protein
VTSWFERFKGRSSRNDDKGDTDTVRRIVGELERLDPARARYLAAFAYLLSRVSRADLKIGPVETDRMGDIVRRVGDLPAGQAALVVEIAKAQSRMFGGTEDFLVTREFRDISTLDQRREVLACLVEIAATEDGISAIEEAEISKVARELDLTHDDYIAALQARSSERNVLRKPGNGPATHD